MTIDTSTHASEDLRTPAHPVDTARLDQAITSLASGARAWADLSLSQRAQLLERTHESIALSVARWTRIASDVKGLDPESQLVGEEWTSGPYAALTGFSAVAASLRKLAAGDSPVDGIERSETPGGRLTWKVLPADLRESVLFHGFSAEVWTLPGVSAEQVRSESGLGATQQGTVGGVGLVLGAGNITSIGPLDVLTELVAHNRTSLLKINPTLSPLLTVYREALGPLIEADLLRVVPGGAEVGGYLSAHPEIAHVHITGSAATHDRIVWGDDTKEARSGAPVLDKPITSELGGVSPVIVVPGRWSKADLKYQAENIATMRLHNAGHNCIAAQTVVIDADWRQREEFLHELRSALERIEDRDPWYPGGQSRLRQAESDHDRVESFSQGRRLLVSIDSDESDEMETTEYFAAVLGIKALTVGSRAQETSQPSHTAAFLHLAVDYANDRLAGTLGANVVIAPNDRKALGSEFDAEIERLHYGAIGINVWTGLAFLTSTATWGAFPGHTLDDVQSGIGVVHNGLLIPHTERTVASGPFRPFPRSVVGGEFSLFPKPPWFVTARSAARTGRALTKFAAGPSWAKLPGIFFHAFRA
ncbi:MAG: aldehyde dehydrogenase family protein [Corynebacterium sp.]|uniref:aldehyde dehydrogenase family protein n=1 Tax=Actinomycetes TaxID=1760 RepID=UPI002648577D|nr:MULTISPECIES: aldehyde dehydrogenase family protein [Actinomycetes]MDN5724139.1 aldehyde dehydrogenase family protein [Corynebacterium sp.]MDN6159147.1 aldehyde dehydrogenase family protein [Brevibacterium sp.]MDN6604173.1 aldehyde dehydrogenase family protein [Brevibacterium sp.]